MKVKVIKPVIANGVAHEVGSVIEVSQYDARQLKAMKKVVEFKGAPVVAREDVEEEEEAKKPVKRGRPKKGAK